MKYKVECCQQMMMEQQCCSMRYGSVVGTTDLMSSGVIVSGQIDYLVSFQFNSGYLNSKSEEKISGWVTQSRKKIFGIGSLKTRKSKKNSGLTNLTLV